MTLQAPETKVPVAVAGATGSVGQRFVRLLSDHPWFDLVAVMASERSAGRRYADAVRWVQSEPIPPPVGDMVVTPCEPSSSFPLVFSALDASVAFDLEAAFASAGTLVVSNAKSHRMAPDVPLVVPEVNPSHLELRRRSRYLPGSIVTNPNCSTIGLALALKPIHERYGVLRVNVVTMQAISGAGLPGVSSYEILDNVVPFISGEEAKLESETRKIFGAVQDGELIEAGITVSAQCNRVPVLDGHLLAVSVELEKKAEASELRAAWEAFQPEPDVARLPSAPRRALHYLPVEDAPQPRLHRDLDNGMAVSVGRLRPCPVLDFKFVTLSHNTVRGAAGGAILLAELDVSRGLFGSGGSGPGSVSSFPNANTTA